jgi:hypothetical protein
MNSRQNEPLHAAAEGMQLVTEGAMDWAGRSPGVMAVQASARSRAFTTDVSLLVALAVGTG